MGVEEGPQGGNGDLDHLDFLEGAGGRRAAAVLEKGALAEDRSRLEDGQAQLDAGRGLLEDLDQA
ncbi:hypothetical protein D3C86_2133370 [compost metagenome]